MLLRVASLVLGLYYFGFFSYLFICISIPQQKITFPGQAFAHLHIAHYLPDMLDKGGAHTLRGERTASASSLGSLIFSEEFWEGATGRKIARIAAFQIPLSISRGSGEKPTGHPSRMQQEHRCEARKHLAAQCGFHASFGVGGELGVDEGARRGSVERGESIHLRPRQLQKQLSEEATGLRQSLAWLRGGEAMPVELKRSQAKKK